tara:strand:- start:367 stop:960 length:594 start_codon:yes stop_codon:yes gene_type:complete
MLSKETILGQIQDVYKEKGYKFFTGDMSVNVFAIRCETGTDSFDDLVGLAYYNAGNLTVDLYKGTTEPGQHWLKNPMREEGCAIMKEGQYLGVYKVGPHGGSQYEACRQYGPISVYRDNNKDGKHDLDDTTVQTGVFMTNLHHGYSSWRVHKNSAGCIVIQNKDEFFDEFMPVIKESCDIHGEKFSFTLLNKNDFDA